MKDEIEKKVKETGNNFAWNIFAIIVGLILVILTPKPLSYLGWVVLVIGGVGFIACFVQAMMLEQESQEQEYAENVKQCPSCAEDIKKAAKKCKHCGEILK